MKGSVTEGSGVKASVPATRVFILAGRRSLDRGYLSTSSAEYLAGQDVDRGLTDAMGGSRYGGDHVGDAGEFGCEAVAITMDSSVIDGIWRCQCGCGTIAQWPGILFGLASLATALLRQ